MVVMNMGIFTKVKGGMIQQVSLSKPMVGEWCIWLKFKPFIGMVGIRTVQQNIIPNKK